MASPVYPSDLSDDEWALLSPLIPAAKPGGRPRSVQMRRILNGLFSVLRSGCAWRYLPGRQHALWLHVIHLVCLLESSMSLALPSALWYA
jgi:transposase